MTTPGDLHLLSDETAAIALWKWLVAKHKCLFLCCSYDMRSRCSGGWSSNVLIVLSQGWCHVAAGQLVLCINPRVTLRGGHPCMIGRTDCCRQDKCSFHQLPHSRICGREVATNTFSQLTICLIQKTAWMHSERMIITSGCCARICPCDKGKYWLRWDRLYPTSIEHSGMHCW